jgi:putative ABC transport system permease protein
MNDFKMRPPKVGGWILKTMARCEDNVSLRGDFDEEFEAIAESEGYRRAWFWYWSHLLKSFPRFVADFLYWRFVMFLNYLKIAWRSMKNDRRYVFIKLTSLAVGLACFLVITFFVRWKLSYDSFHERGDRICRVVVRGNFNMGKTTMSVIPSPMAAAIADEFPEAANVARVHPLKDWTFKYQDKKSFETGLAADENFLRMFTFPLAKGDAGTALRDPLTIVLTESLGRKYFGNEDPVGKTLTIPNFDGKSFDYKITGILKDVPKNSHLRFDFIVSLVSVKVLNGESDYLGTWGNWDAVVYVELSRGADPRAFAAKLAPFYEKHAGRKSGDFILQPLKSIHLRSDAFGDAWSSQTYGMGNIYLLSCIAVIILMIACVNYINLATARASKRMTEIGLRKIVGASRNQLIKQFLAESVLLTLISFGAALLIAVLAIPGLSSFIDKPSGMDIFRDKTFLAGLAGLAFLVGILAGIFPALVLSSLRPVNALRKSLARAKRNFNFRNLMVVVQFGIAIILIVGTQVIIRQMTFIQRGNMGYDRDEVLVVDVRDSKLQKNFLPLKTQILQNPKILGASMSRSLPYDIVPMLGARVEEGTLPSSRDRFSSYYTIVDQNFLDFYGIPLLSGRNFSEKNASESEEAVIINETAARQLGWKDPLGKMYQVNWKAKNGRVIGVIKDFHFQSLHRPIEALTLMFDSGGDSRSWGGYLSLKVNTTDLNRTIASIRTAVESFIPDRPFTYFFLDDAFNELYKTETKLGVLFRGFSALALILSCLGLYGLASFTIERRTKEVGIRKVLGATLPGVFFLLTKEFLKWVLLVNLVAWPMAFFLMNKWLQSFAYRIHLGVLTLVSSSAIALMIALLTISLQTVKAGTANPVDSLRYE